MKCKALLMECMALLMESKALMYSMKGGPDSAKSALLSLKQWHLRVF